MDEKDHAHKKKGLEDGAMDLFLPQEVGVKNRSRPEHSKTDSLQFCRMRSTGVPCTMSQSSSIKEHAVRIVTGEAAREC